MFNSGEEPELSVTSRKWSLFFPLVDLLSFGFFTVAI